MSASGATITQVSVCKMRVAIVVQTTVALLLLLLLSPAQVGTRKVALRESLGQICPVLFKIFYLLGLCFKEPLKVQLTDLFKSPWAESADACKL